VNRGSPVAIHNDSTCLGRVECFRDGFSAHDELLGVPEKDGMICMSRGATTIQIVRVMKKYITDNPDKAHLQNLDRRFDSASRLQNFRRQL
jgi:hypothetical protein